MIQRIVRKALWGLFFCFFEKFFVPILTSGGYVGLSIATLLSQHHKVMAVDIVPEKVELINNKKSPIQDEYIEKYLAEKELDLTATLDAKEACCNCKHNSTCDGWTYIFYYGKKSVFDLYKYDN